MPWTRRIALPLAVGAAVVACSAPPSGAPPSPSSSPSPPSAEVKLRRVSGFGAGGRVAARRLREPARSVADTIASIYQAAYLDLEAWRDGRSSEHLAAFTEDAVREARTDVRNLALGSVGSRLTSVRARPIRTSIRFLLNRNRRPMAAVASVRFDGAGQGQEGPVQIHQRADLTLRRIGGRWRVAAYEADGRVGGRRGSPSSFAPPLASGDPLIVLVIGSDARPDQSVTRSRADSLHLVGVDPRRNTASVVGIPRDSFVPIAGRGTEKINASLVLGGPETTVQTVERLTGAKIDAYVLTGFLDFRKLITQAGGVEVRIPYGMNDRFSGAHFRPGRTRLSGRRALAFSRNRHDAPGGDFGRSMNQGRLLIAALAEFREDVRTNPVDLFRWFWAGAGNVRTDLSLDEMFRLALAALTIDPGRVDNRVVGGSGATVGGQSVIRLGSSARAIFRDLARDGVIG